MSFDLDYVDVIDIDGNRAIPTPAIGDIEFTLYGDEMQPPVDTETGGRYVTKRPIGEDPVRQYQGPELKKLTMTGECTVTTASDVDNLTEKAEVRLRSFRHSGHVQIDDTSTTSMGKYYDGQKVYKFVVDMTEVP